MYYRKYHRHAYCSTLGRGKGLCVCTINIKISTFGILIQSYCNTWWGEGGWGLHFIITITVGTFGVLIVEFGGEG